MWLILKTDIAKEFEVARALAAIGHECWVPTYVATAYERFTAGPGIVLRRKKPIERPLMPSLVLMEDDPHRPRLPSSRYLRGYWTDCFELPLVVPDVQISRFRERVEEVNAAETARIMKARLGKRKGKRTVKLDPTLADELKAMLFGQQAQEAA